MPTVVRIGSACHGGPDKPPVERYHMKDVWTLHLYTYDGILEVGGTTYQIRPGAISLAPPWSDLVYRFTQASYHISAFFTFPPDACGFRNVPVIQYFDPQPSGPFDRLLTAMEEARGFYPLFMTRAQVRVWDILLSVADYGDAAVASDRSFPRHLRESVSFIENNLYRRLTVAEVAGQVDLTTTHLARVFRKWLGGTVIGYIRWRRALRARDMLLHTSNPVKKIAAEVGIPDIQHFYKTMKKEFNQTPIEIRRGNVTEGNRFSYPFADGPEDETRST